MESKETYLQFPLFLIRGLFTDKEKTINDIIRYGIYRFAKRQKFNLYDVAKQLMYSYYRKQGDLTNDLLKTIEGYISNEMIDIDEDYNGFVGALNQFNPGTAIEQLLNIFGYNAMTDEINEENCDNDFYSKAIEFYQIKQAYNFLGITGDYDNCLKVGKQIEKTIPEHEPFPPISKSLLFDFRDKEKTEFDLMQFAAYISIRSILGTKTYCRTNKEMIVCRMFGYASKKHLPDKMNPAINDLFSKYSKRYHIDRLLQHLEINWNVLTYSNNIRGMYVANKKKITISELALIAQTKKKKNQIAKLKEEKREATEKALQQLNKGQQLKKESVNF